jgi:hypothetical protein
MANISVFYDSPMPMKNGEADFMPETSLSFPRHRQAMS